MVRVVVSTLTGLMFAWALGHMIWIHIVTERFRRHLREIGMPVRQGFELNFPFGALQRYKQWCECHDVVPDDWPRRIYLTYAAWPVAMALFVLVIKGLAMLR